jgi:threonine/homoserine/homoserine lactone efflux protein
MANFIVTDANGFSAEVPAMFESLLMPAQFGTFLLASLLLAVTPGPGVIYILTQTLSHGRSAGLASVCGIALGNLANAVVASLGLAVVVATSAAAFTLVKFLGAAYLVFLGVQRLRAGSGAPRADGERQRLPPARLFRTAFLVALFNPKTALFFAALLPQFIEPGRAPLAQSLLLGSVFVLVALGTDACYVFAAAALRATLRRGSRWRPLGRYLSAATFMGLGVYAALARAPAGK